jgi:hypothetical protein
MSVGVATLVAVLEALGDAINELAEADPAKLADPGSVVSLHRLQAQLDAITTRAVAAFDAGCEWRSDGAQTAAQWVATECRLPRGVARRRVALGRRLRSLQACEQAWLEGEINADHVRVIARLQRRATDAPLERDEPMLVDSARCLRFEAFCRIVAYWDQLADPDGADDAEDRRFDRRDVHLDQSFAGLFFGRMTLDPVGGTIVSDELERRARALFEEDWAEARARLGREPTLAELGRTPGQRRADALVAMATAARTAPRDGRRPAPLFTVLVGYETLYGRICELANGTVLSPVALLPWLDQAYIERAVFAPGGRVDVSEHARLFTGATRRAIELRDRGCTHPYCDIPGERCEVDHVIPYADGGSTTQANGRLACDFHNRLRQRRGPPPPPEPDG